MLKIDFCKLKKMIFLLNVFCTSSIFAWDCNYDHKISLVENYHSYQTIFRGNVKSIKKILINNEVHSEIIFNILENYKGSTKDKATILQKNIDSDFYFIRGQEWIVWANQSGNYLSTSQCTPTKLAQNTTAFEKTLIKSISITTGYKVWYDEKGDKLAEGTIITNKATGVWKYYFYGFLNSTGNYINGLKEGQWTSFLESFFYQRIFTEQNYEIIKTLLNEDNSFLRKISSIANYKNGKLNGEFVKYDMFGKIKSTAFYKENKHWGNSIVYGFNGKPKKIYNYINDKINGIVISFFDSGSIELICNYVNDMPQGEWTLYDENGIIICCSKNGNKFPEIRQDKYYCIEN